MGKLYGLYDRHVQSPAWGPIAAYVQMMARSLNNQ